MKTQCMHLAFAQRTLPHKIAKSVSNMLHITSHNTVQIRKKLLYTMWNVLYDTQTIPSSLPKTKILAFIGTVQYHSTILIGTVYNLHSLIFNITLMAKSGDWFIRQIVKQGKKRNTSATFISTITLAAILVILVIFIGNYFIVRKVKSSGEATENEDSTPSIESLQFDFGTIRDATDNFFDVNKLGEGCASKWARIAVKKLSGNSRQGQEEFKNEVLLLTKLRHKNLVSLLGFCLEEKELLLIYEFMPNKSVDHFIFDHVKRAHLDWKKRFNIIQGFARGLLYLHEDSQHRIIHRDLKASNILLDAEMNHKISDFGTGRLIALDKSHYTASRIMGTIGQKIFCFRDVENGEDLLSCVSPESEIMRCIHTGLLCVQENAADKPTMAIVVSMLISTSFSLSLPSHPAFLLPERQGQGNLSHEFNSMTESDQSETKSTQISTNDVTITELVARW
ncbi:hypothetical protein TEA_026375 [Camellia sinensis var. sinensis]|uniref:non-specific serine/threonine protein kinase n=1 Tax=Camellia sinensis var. sinensis TaxID=542762 RepID=A0A4S4D3L7_CAMSN|nr:hypothetical protein TEA_026375 [Camellia sinensis var. sinensis]